jgi:hypothetical protein
MMNLFANSKNNNRLPMIRMTRLSLMRLPFITFPLLVFATGGIGQELELPSIPPTIEELTNGTVKVGDLITKDNVDVVKEYLPVGLYECVKNGMVLNMGKNPPPEKINPKTYLETTERNKGKAIVDDHMVVRYQDGSEWPGGIPFPEPKTVQELMGNYRFGIANDNYELFEHTWSVNNEGNLYKTKNTRFFRYWTDGRLKVPPLGSVPGHEDYHCRSMGVTVAPQADKGFGLLQINFDDNTARCDIGFIHSPQFKRTMRISATTFQDRLQGSDFTMGDPEGLSEPFGFWNFRLIEEKFMLTPELIRDRQPTYTRVGISMDPQVAWDEGKKYPRLGWAITPVYIVEATAKDTAHIYSKKILYLNPPYYAQSTVSRACAYADIYARTGEMWKFYYDWGGGSFTHKDGEHYTASTGFSMHDLKSGHQSHVPMYTISVDDEMKPEFISLKKLIELGK